MEHEPILINLVDDRDRSARRVMARCVVPGMTGLQSGRCAPRQRDRQFTRAECSAAYPRGYVLPRTKLGQQFLWQLCAETTLALLLALALSGELLRRVCGSSELF